MKRRKGVVINSVELVMFNDGDKIDINHNEEFCDKIAEMVEQAVAEYRLEEFFNEWVEIYRFSDGTYGMYFTVPQGGHAIGDTVDGYIIKSNDHIALFDQLAFSRGYCGDSGYIEELIDKAVSEGVILKQK